MTDDIGMYKLTDKDIDKGTTVLCSAFFNYPAFVYLFPDTGERKRKLRHVMRFFLNCALLRGEILAPSKNIESVCILYKSIDLDIGLYTLFNAGLIGTICNLSFKSFIKFKKLGDAKRKNRDSLIDREYYFIDLIGTDPALEKKGYAGALIEAVIKKSDADKTCCFLETSKIENINFYTRYGFRLFHTYGFGGLTSYCMIRN